MDVLVIGSGGREHALAWAISKSPSVGRVYAGPGNPGTASVAANVPLDPSDFDGIAAFCKDQRIDLVVVGPENPLADGIADHLCGQGMAVFGPGRAGARLEASKSLAMEFMERHGIPHPWFRGFDDPALATAFIKSTRGPWVLKADGLALGKGVTITSDEAQAVDTAKDLLSGNLHGGAGRRIVMEEFLAGEEITAMALTDGKALLPLPLARDHKRVFDGDRGPMTGGMGAFSPVTLPSPRDMERAIIEDVLERTIKGLQQEGIRYRGAIYAGIMITRDGPKVLEYNVRFGDPETQCVLPRVQGDFAGALMACASGRLGAFAGAGGLRVRPEPCISVVMASGGYPSSYRKGLPIAGLDPVGPGEVAASGVRGLDEDVIVFHAGTREEGGMTVTSGGRVLAVTALGPSLPAAAEKAYRRVGAISFEGAHFRRDIAGGAS